MFSAHIFFAGLIAVALAATLTWFLSLLRHNVAVVDSLWSLMFMLAAYVYAGKIPVISPRGMLLLALLTIWALRLSIFITWRNRGQGEDRRYRAIRARNEPRFALKSLYLVFLLQAFLAWVISLPLLGAILSERRLWWLDFVGVALFAVGFVFEAGGDWQLARFKADLKNHGSVMDRGFWRLTRHPNYFGDFCVWWGLYVLAAAGGAWWSIVAPILMSVLLMRVSGVTLLEKDIGERRPDYADYIRRTNAFFPGFPKRT